MARVLKLCKPRCNTHLSVYNRVDGVPPSTVDVYCSRDVHHDGQHKTFQWIATGLAVVAWPNSSSIPNEGDAA